jgi:hypothetical protein
VRVPREASGRPAGAIYSVRSTTIAMPCPTPMHIVARPIDARVSGDPTPGGPARGPPPRAPSCAGTRRRAAAPAPRRRAARAAHRSRAPWRSAPRRRRRATYSHAVPPPTPCSSPSSCAPPMRRAARAPSRRGRARRSAPPPRPRRASRTAPSRDATRPAARRRPPRSGRARGRDGRGPASPVSPLTGRDTRRQNELLRPIVERAGFDHLGGLIATPRSLIQVFEFVYDTKDRAQTHRAYAACRELVVAAARAGYGEYRAHLSA